MSTTDLLTYAALASLLVITPGSDTMVLLRNALRGGSEAAVRTAFGGRLGLVVHGTLSSLGVSAVIAHSAEAYRVLQLLGAAYLVFLGLRSLIAGLRAASSPRVDARSARSGRPFREGFLSNVLNPKTAVFYVALLPQFVGPGEGALLRSAGLCLLHIAISLTWYLSLAWGFGRARAFLETRTRAHRLLDGVNGCVLLGLGVGVALGRRPGS